MPCHFSLHINSPFYPIVCLKKNQNFRIFGRNSITMKNFVTTFFFLLGGFVLLNGISASNTPEDKRWNIGVYTSTGPSSHPDAQSLVLYRYLRISLDENYFVRENLTVNGKFFFQSYFSFSYKLNPNNEIFIGMGYSRYFLELDYIKNYPLRGNVSFPAKESRQTEFVTWHIGYTYIFSNEKLLNPFVSLKVNYENAGTSFNYPGWGGQFSAGYQTKPFKGISASIALFAKKNFGRDSSGKEPYFGNFAPLSYGIEIGLQYSF